MICRRDITVHKVWNDSENAHGKRPASVDINLLRDGEVYKTAAINSAGSGIYTFRCLPVGNSNTEYEYEIEELTVPGYTTEIRGFTVTNTLKTITISGTKIWDDNNNESGTRPNAIVVNLLQNDIIFKAVPLVVAPNVATVPFSFADLSFADAQKKPFVYKVDEETVVGYTKSIDGFNITNKK